MVHCSTKRDFRWKYILCYKCMGIFYDVGDIMYCVKQEYGDAGRYFLTENELEKEFCNSYYNPIYIEEFSSFISKLTLEDTYDILEKHITKLEDNIWVREVSDILTISCNHSDEICLCSKEKYKNDKLSIFNKVAEEFNLSFSAFLVKKMTIAVVDNDHEPLRDMYQSGGITLWHNVDSFIEDTQYYIDEHHEDIVISTYGNAVKYWENMDFTVVSNYCEVNGDNSADILRGNK